MRHPGNVLLVWCQRVLEAVSVAQKLEDTVQPVIGLGFDTSAMKNVDHEGVWMLSSLEAHSTFTNWSKWRLFIEMSLLTTRTDADADFFFLVVEEHGGAEGEVKSCRPLFTSLHVLVRALGLLTFHNVVFKRNSLEQRWGPPSRRRFIPRLRHSNLT